MSAIGELFRIPTDRPALMHSQLEALTKQIPLLYLILVVNSLAVSFTHFGVAPWTLTVIFPAVLSTVSLVRLYKWVRTRGEVLTDAMAAKRLSSTAVLAGVLGAIYISWGLSLYQYGDAYTRGHVAFFTGITVVSCIFCLMHLRPAALTLTVVVIIPFTIFFLATGRPVFVAIAINLLLVSVAMVYILITYSRDFATMIAFQTELVEKQAETQRLNDENARLANRDALTGLPNRRQFFSDLNAVWRDASLEGRRFVVGLIDLDGFKPINDVYGHVTGDRVLIEIGARLEAFASAGIFLSRLGGDEFGVLIDTDMGEDDILDFGDRLCASLGAPLLFPDITTQVTGSVGFATFPEAGATTELLFERADYALYHAKEHRRGRPILFSREHETEIRRFGLIDQNLRQADLETELFVHFQPLFDTDLGRPVAFEALARWNSPELGLVPPDAFIRVAERSDLINTMTRVLLRKALAEAATWPEPVRLAFNLSMRDLTASDAISRIIAIIRDSGVAPSRIDLEITETALINDFDQSEENLQSLKALGIRISLDDFGTGYSSLGYLHRLPLDKIKIDRNFVQDIEFKAKSRNIMKAMIDLCGNLKLTCVVEGMENREQVRILRGLGCRFMQGYYHGRPMPAEAVADLIASFEDIRQTGT